MKKKLKISLITRTAIFIALLLVIQMVTKSIGQLVTGSLVNFILIASVVTCGITCGTIVAIFSPVLAFFAGIGAQIPQIVFVIMIGNLSLVVVWHLLCRKPIVNDYITYSISAVAAAIIKFGVLYIGIVKIALPIFLSNLPEKQVAVMSATFSTPQLITALIGGVIAVVALPLLKKAIKKL